MKTIKKKILRVYLLGQGSSSPSLLTPPTLFNGVGGRDMAQARLRY